MPSTVPRALSALNYSFIYSFHFLTTPLAAEIVRRYRLVAKSDLDVMVTPSWRRWWPKKFQIGKGAYANVGTVRERLRLLARKLGLRHQVRAEAQCRRCNALVVLCADSRRTEGISLLQISFPPICTWYRC